MSNAMWLIWSQICWIKYRSLNCETLVAHLRACQFPRYKSSSGKQLYRLFEEMMTKKQHKRKSLVANASQQFTLYAMLRDWALAEAEDTPELYPHLAVYLKACDVIDVIRFVKYRQLSTAAAKPRLLTALGEWQDLHKLQYGKRYIKPKNVWMWNIANRFADSAWLFDMFYIERQHQRVRPAAELVKNTIDFEASVLFRVCENQISSLKCSNPLQHNYHLVGRQVSIAGDIIGSMSKQCKCGGAVLAVNDIVVNRSRGTANVILACILCGDGRLLVRVEMLW